MNLEITRFFPVDKKDAKVYSFSAMTEAKRGEAQPDTFADLNSPLGELLVTHHPAVEPTTEENPNVEAFTNAQESLELFKKPELVTEPNPSLWEQYLDNVDDR